MKRKENTFNKCYKNNFNYWIIIDAFKILIFFYSLDDDICLKFFLFKTSDNNFKRINSITKSTKELRVKKWKTTQLKHSQSRYLLIYMEKFNPYLNHHLLNYKKIK